MHIWRRAVSALLATALAAAIPISGLANNTSGAGNTSTAADYPWVSDWQAGDPTSSVENRYQIYPVPQQVTYPKTGDSVTLSGAVQVSVGSGVSQSTKDYIREVLEEVNCTVSFVAADSSEANLSLGIQGDGSAAANVFQGTDLTTTFEHDDSYALRVSDGKVSILGSNDTGVFYGVATLKMMLSSLAGHKLVPVDIQDWADIPLRGIVEGFYGGFTHSQRVSLMKFSRDTKLNIFIYAAKSDAYHTTQWADLYPDDYINHFKELVALAEETKCEFSWSVHLGSFFRALTEDNYHTQMAKLTAKFDQLRDIGVNRFCVLNDDFGAGSTAMVVRVMNDLNQNYVHTYNLEPMIYCSQNYNNAWSNGNGKQEITALTALDNDIMMFWTGRDVNSPFYQDSIDYVIQNTVDADGVSQTPVFWVNYPCSEHAKSGVFLGSSKYYLRDDITGLGGAVSNPIFFAETDKVALFQLANYWWNTGNAEENADAVWEQTFKYLQPEVYDAYLTIARNLSDAPNSSRVPAGGFPESEYLKEYLNNFKAAVADGTLTGDDANAAVLLAEFDHILQAIETFQTQCTNQALVKELTNPGYLSNVEDGEGWLQALANVVTAGKALIQAELELAKAEPDTSVVWSSFSTATAQLGEYNARRYTFPDGSSQHPKAGSQKLVPFANTLMADVQTYIDGLYGQMETPAGADRIYTNLESLAKTPLTIQDDTFSLRALGQLTLNSGDYVGIKKAGIAQLSALTLEGTGLDGLTLEYSLHGDDWVEAQPGDLESQPLARCLRLVNKGDAAVTCSVAALGMTVSNQVYPVQVVDNNMGGLYGGTSWSSVLDGDLNTYAWTSKGQAVGDYMIIDTGRTQPIHDVTVYTTDGGDCIRAAQLFVSDSAEGPWESIGTVSNSGTVVPPHRTYTYDGSGTQGRYLKLQLTQGASNWLKLYEVQINQKIPAPAVAASQAVVDQDGVGQTALTDNDLTSVYTLSSAPADATLVYRITDNTQVRTVTILQSNPCNATVTATLADGSRQELGTADASASTFQLPEGKSVHTITLTFPQDSQVSINEILLGCDADPSGDVGQAVENIYADEIPDDSTESVNLALNQPVEVSGTETASVKPESAVDGTTDTKWDSAPLKGSNAQSPQWIIVDLGSYTNLISSISADYFNKVYPTDYQVQVSNDKEHWVTLKSLTHENNGATYPVDTVTLDTPVSARYVKLNFVSINSAAAGNCIGLRELTVNGVRRTASLQYTAVTSPENVQLEVNAEYTLPQLLTASVQAAGGAEEAISVQVLPTWTPAEVDTTAQQVVELTGSLPLTHSLTNPQGLAANYTVTVGNPVVDETDVNLALNAPVTVSAVELNYDGQTSTGYVGANAVDGSTSTRWSSGALNDKSAGTVADQWIQVDLGEQAVAIDQVKVAFFNKVWPTQYHIQLSNDGQTWTQVHTVTHQAANSAIEPDAIDFETPVSARYLRLYFPQGELNPNAAGGSVSITELTVTGDRYAAPVSYAQVTDQFSTQTFDNDATTADLTLPQLISVVWNTQAGAQVPVQVLASWNTQGFDALTDGTMDLTATLPASDYITNPSQLTAVQPVVKGDTAPPEPQTYTISVTAGEGGTAAATPTTAAAGTTVTLTQQAAAGYHFKEWQSADVEIAADGTFTMPDKAVTITAVFEAHTTELQNDKEPTCTEDGYTGDRVCTVCGETIQKGETIAALGHKTELQNAKNATCTEEGYTGDLVCTVCGETIQKGETIPATGHKFEDGVCTVCGAEDPDYVEPTQKPEPSTEPTQKPEPTTQPTQEPQVTQTPETTQQPQATGKPQATQQPDTVPPTGDASQLMVYVAAMGAAALLLGAAVVARKRRG